jgi:hypothetical protein
MKVDRESFLASVRILRPATADKSPIEGLTHVWFLGEVAFAYNDVIGIETPCAVQIDGGLLGSTLLGFLEKSTAKEVDIEATDKEAVIKQSGARVKLPVLALDRAVTPFPAELGDPSCIIDAAFRNALAHVMVSCSPSGVVLVPEEQELAFYTTDGLSLSWARIPLPDGYVAERLSLSSTFCDQLLKICEEDAVLYLTVDSAIAVTADGTRLFGRLLEQQRERDFAGTINANLEGPQPTPIPPSLGLVLERTQVLVISGQVAKVLATIEAGVMRLNLRTDRGDLAESLSLAKPHPAGKIEGVFDSAIVLRGLGGAERFLLNDRAFTLLGPIGGYMAAAPTK